MVAFNRQNSKLRAIEIKQRRARIQARQGHSDMKLKHPDWCRDASGDHPNYSLMNKKIKEECEKAQLKTEKFRSKLYERKS